MWGTRQPIIASDHCAISYFSRQYDRALQECGDVLAMHPHFSRAQSLLIGAYAQKGDFAKALELAEEWRRSEGDSPWIWSAEANLYGRSGQKAKAREAFDKMRKSNLDWKMDPVFMLPAYLGTGDNESAIAVLQQAFRERSHALTTLKADPTFDPLRSDPRFQQILAQVGLSQ